MRGLPLVVCNLPPGQASCLDELKARGSIAQVPFAKRIRHLACAGLTRASRPGPQALGPLSSQLEAKNAEFFHRTTRCQLLRIHRIPTDHVSQTKAELGIGEGG